MSDEKLKEYQERYHFWSDKRTSQFSFQNNIFLTIGLAIMGYFWKERSSVYTELIIDPHLKIDLKIVLFFLGMAILLYSIITGLLLSISRLYDLRLTSNILLTRKRALKNNVQIKDEKLSETSLCKCVCSFCSVYKQYTQVEIKRDDIKTDNENLQSKFTNARQISKDLGNCTWRLMKNQTISLFLSICTLMIVLFLK